MKIGILTLTPTENYGGILQAVGLRHVLTDLEHEVVLINKVHYFSFWKKIVHSVLSRIPLQNFKNIRKTHLKKAYLKDFISSHLPNVSRKIFSHQELESLVEEEKFGAVVVGSDQVWRYAYINDAFYSVYFLDFKKKSGVRKISYAASFGKATWEAPDEIERVKKLLSDFDAISVREKSGVVLCKQLFGVKAYHHADPTLLAGREFYEQLAGESKELARYDVVTYILDLSKKKKNFIESMIVKNRAFSHRTTQINLAGGGSGRIFSVEEWLYAIKNAEYVITDSFHGMIFSVMFSRQFVVFGNVKRGISRFVDFLNTVGLTDRLVADGEPIENALLKKIDYADVHKKLDAWRQNSCMYLKKSLDNYD